METLMSALRYFILITAELTVLFMGISTIVSLVLMYIPHEKMRSWLSRRGLWGNFLGSLVGSLTPFCACSTIPMTLGMLNAGAPFGSVMSFVIASPLLNPIIISIIVGLMGVKAALLYFTITFIGSILFGWSLDLMGFNKHVKNVRAKNQDPRGEWVPETFWGKLKAAFKTAWSDFRAVLVYLLIGVGLAAGIYGYVPQEFVAKIAGPQNPFAIPVAALVGIPLYIRAETAIPIGTASAQKGMSIGAVIALIIGGAGMAIPEMSMLASIFKKKLVGAIVGVIFSTAVLGGIIFNFVL